MARRPTRPRVMQSFGPPRPTSNPYVHMLDAALASTDGLEHLRFSWRTALLGRIDVLHFHWPETLIGGRTPLRRTVRRARFQLLLWTLRLHGVAIVRTVHNLELPSGLPRWERAMLDAVRRRASMEIALNDSTPVGPTGAVIPHGHYVDWFAGMPRADEVPGRIGFVGLVRRYKGVDALVDAYADLRGRDANASLLIAGRPTTQEQGHALLERLADVPGATARLAYLSEEDYALAVSSSSLVVLPYVHMHNSGSALAALSLDRPVLVPRNAVNEALAQEAGEEWVLLFDGELDASALGAALDRASMRAPGARPDLTARGWAEAGRAHLAAYRRALG